MLLTSLAMVDLETRGVSLGSLLRTLVERLRGRRHPAAGPVALRVLGPPAPAEAPAADRQKAAGARQDDAAPFPWRRHPQLLTHGAERTISLSERRARAAVVRGLFNVHTGDYEAARLAFAEAAREPGIDLGEAPGFWQLPRAGLTAAVLAYEDAGRLREAAALAAEIGHRLRPQPLPAARPRRAAASGS